jgi:RNA polymerase sigma-70 factor, ECF subfamily
LETYLVGDRVTDEELMDAYAAGDPAAFEALFARVAPRVHAFFVRSFGDIALADDLLQVTFMKLHRARADYRRGSPLRSWLFSIAAHVRLDELRRRRRVREDVDAETVERTAGGEPDGPEVASDRVDVATAVRAAVDRLPEGQRVIVHLHRLEGLSFADIARMLGMTEGAVRQRAFRGYVALRKDLAPLVAAREGVR